MSAADEVGGAVGGTVNTVGSTLGGLVKGALLGLAITVGVIAATALWPVAAAGFAAGSLGLTGASAIVGGVGGAAAHLATGASLAALAQPFIASGGAAATYPILQSAGAAALSLGTVTGGLIGGGVNFLQSIGRGAIDMVQKARTSAAASKTTEIDINNNPAPLTPQRPVMVDNYNFETGKGAAAMQRGNNALSGMSRQA